MKVLVTGGAGFIGSHLVRGLLAEGHSVRVVDNLSTGFRWRLDEVSDRIDFIEADLSHPGVAERVADAMEVILHQAAIPSVARSNADPVQTCGSNVLATVALLQAARQSGVRRMVYAASSSAYGTSPTLPKVETMCSNPLSPYAVSKLAGEQYCQVFAGLGFVETVCLRYFNVFGPMQDPNSQYAAVIPKFIQSMLRGEPLPLDGDGSQSRDFTYIDNVVRVNMLAMEAEGVSGEVLNVGCGYRIDLNTLISELSSILGKEAVVERRASRPGDVPHSLADISKARAMLGYEPTVSLREGLERTIKWFSERV